MRARLPGKLAGSVRWAVAPFAAEPPFRLYAAGRDPIQLDDAEQLVDAARQGGDAEFTYLVSAKARPLLILTDPARSDWHEVVALRLRRFSSIADPQRQERIRQHGEPLYFYLDPRRFRLPEEHAVLIPALVPVNVGAISLADPPGVLDENEMRVIGERLIRHFGFDVRSLVEQRTRELARRRERG